MPRVYKRDLSSCRYVPYTATKLQAALDAIRGGITQREASIRYGIPRSTLKNKLHGRHSKKAGGQTILTTEEEEAFTKYCMTMSTFGFPLDTWDLRCIVKSYLDRQGRILRQFHNNLPGKEWTLSFLKRHRVLTLRFASNIKRKRAEISADVIDEYFNYVENELQNIPPSNIWNYDETNLTDDPGNKRVITKRGVKYPERIINSTKTATSLMFCGNAQGEILPPYVVYKAESMWSTWTENGPAGTRYNRSKSGWFDAQCFEDWFRSLLLPRLKKSHPGRNVLIGDNLSSHINLEVLQLCEQNDVAFVALPPNSTHLTQPLDVAYFRPMKVAWRKILTDWKMKGKGKKAAALPKDEFPRLLNLLMTNLGENGKDNLISGFRKTGIYPLDKQQVLARLPSEIIQKDAGAGIPVHEVVSESFIEHLAAARGNDDGTGNSRRKRQKVSVTPGKSVCVDDVQRELQNKAAKSKKTATDTTSSTPEPVTGSATTSAGISDAQLSCIIQQDYENELTLNDQPDTDVEPSDDEQSPVQSDSCDSSDDDLPLKTYAAKPESSKHTSTGIEKGNFVIVDYEGVKYPGIVVELKKSGAEVSTMCQSGVNWKWPSKPDKLIYSNRDIVEVISEPTKIGRRGAIKVPEMDKYL